MASKYWIKLYHEILDDPKMGRLPNHLWRRAIELFLLAGEMDKLGRLPPIEDMAWKLRANPDQLETELVELSNVNITAVDSQGWVVVHFEERQDADSHAERQKRYRDARRPGNGKSPQSVTDDGTFRHADIEEDIDIDEDKEEEGASASSSGSFSSNIGAFNAFVKVTGMMAYPGTEAAKCEEAMNILTIYHKNDLVEFLQPYWNEWIRRKYSRTNCAWLYDWAISGQIPPEKQKQNANGQRSEPLPKEDSPEEIERKKAIVLEGYRRRLANAATP